MDLYILDKNLTYSKIIPEYESLIWTTRFQDHGDFVLSMKYDEDFLNGLIGGQFLKFEKSNVPMIIENISTESPSISKEHSRKMMEIKGRSASSFLRFRSNAIGIVDNRDEEFSGVPGDIARWIVSKYCVNPATAGANNVIPYLTTDPNTPSGASVILNLTRGPIDGQVKALANGYDFGFTIDITMYPSKILTYRSYKGTDYSNSGNNNYRLYSERIGTLKQTSYFEDLSKYVNHIKVRGKRIDVDVYAPGFNSSVSGFNRRTLVLDASDIEVDTNAPISADTPALVSRGRQALNDPSNKHQILMDGETIDKQGFLWGDLKLGDIVRTIGADGVQVRMRVSELIHSINASGYTQIPTFESI